MATISLVMIVKDEDKVLRRCLESVKSIVDEFVVCDTGSTDATRDIIREYGEPVKLEFTDYVATKNAALALAHGDYILLMDADEYVLTGLDKLKAYAEQGADCVLTTIAEGLDANFTQTYYRARMWRNNSAHRFVGPGVHEFLQIPGKRTCDSSIIVRHDHSHRNPDGDQAKYKRWREILENYLAQHPGDTRATFYLARTLKDLNYPLLAIDQFMAYLDLQSGFRDERWQAAFDAAMCYKSLGEYDQARAMLQLAIGIDRRRAEAFVTLGLLSFHEQDWAQAAKYFEQASRLPIPTDVVLFLEPRCYREIPLEHLTICYDRMKQYRKALGTYERLFGDQPLREPRVIANFKWLHQRTRQKIFFALGHTPEPVYGGMIERQGVGGVETTYLELPTELARLGHDVFVFCRCDAEHVFQNVNFIPYDKMGEYARLDPDLLITSRWFDALYVPGTARAKKIIWLQDSHFADPNHADAWDAASAVVVSSEWHRQYVAERFGHTIKGDKLHVVPLGIRKELYTQSVEREPYKAIYSSNPDRGLYILMQMWDELTRVVPGLHLTVAYGWDGLKTWDSGDAWQQKTANDQAAVEDWANRVGNVRITGRLKKSDLAREQLSAAVCLYPNNFQETFCLTALEMQAAGVPTITTRYGALSNVLCAGGNVLIRHDPFGKAYRDEFVATATELLENRHKRNMYGQACREFAMNGAFDWSDIAESWERVFFGLG
jgi:glycosyltransferase involved in cell wall biosynthesis